MSFVREEMRKACLVLKNLSEKDFAFLCYSFAFSRFSRNKLNDWCDCYSSNLPRKTLHLPSSHLLSWAKIWAAAPFSKKMKKFLTLFNVCRKCDKTKLCSSTYHYFFWPHIRFQFFALSQLLQQTAFKQQLHPKHKHWSTRVLRKQT